MATGSSFMVILNSPAPYWQQTLYPYVPVISKVYAPSATYAVLETAPPSIKVPALSPRVQLVSARKSSSLVPTLTRSIYRLQCSVSMPQRRQDGANRRIDPVLGTARVDAGDVLPDTLVAPAYHSNLRAFARDRRSRLDNILTTARHTGTEHDGVNNVAIVQVVARFSVRSHSPRAYRNRSPPGPHFPTTEA
jgi:hypothetical protein